MVKKIQYKSNKFEYPEFLFEYLYSYIFRFSINSGTLEKDVLTLKKDELVKFKLVIENSLRELFNECYIEPSHKNKSKYPTRYRKIEFENRLYTVDFRTNPVGNTAYGISILLNWIDAQIKEYKGT